MKYDLDSKVPRQLYKLIPEYFIHVVFLPLNLPLCFAPGLYPSILFEFNEFQYIACDTSIGPGRYWDEKSHKSG